LCRAFLVAGSHRTTAVHVQDIFVDHNGGVRRRSGQTVAVRCGGHVQFGHLHRRGRTFFGHYRGHPHVVETFAGGAGLLAATKDNDVARRGRSSTRPSRGGMARSSVETNRIFLRCDFRPRKSIFLVGFTVQSKHPRIGKIFVVVHPPNQKILCVAVAVALNARHCAPRTTNWRGGRTGGRIDQCRKTRITLVSHDLFGVLALFGLAPKHDKHVTRFRVFGTGGHGGLAQRRSFHVQRSIRGLLRCPSVGQGI